MKHKAFVEAIRNESLGFLLGNPWRYGEQSISCVVPILRQTKTRQSYFVLAKAPDVEITDTGSIDKAMVYNKGDKPIFIRMGEIFKGQTQERTAIMSRIVMPKKKVEIEVGCVHASKGISAGTEFKSGGYAPMRDHFYASTGGKGSSAGRISQSASWDMDRTYTSHAGNACNAFNGSSFNISMDDLSSVHQKTQEVFDEVLKKVPLFDNQIGMSLIDDRGFHSLDCFDIPLSWKDVKEAIAGKECLAISQTDDEGVFVYQPDRAKKVIKDVLKKGFEERVGFEEKDVKTILLSQNGYAGEVVTLKDNIIHLLLARE